MSTTDKFLQERFSSINKEIKSLSKNLFKTMKRIEDKVDKVDQKVEQVVEKQQDQLLKVNSVELEVDFLKEHFRELKTETEKQDNIIWREMRRKNKFFMWAFGIAIAITTPIFVFILNSLFKLIK